MAEGGNDSLINDIRDNKKAATTSHRMPKTATLASGKRRNAKVRHIRQQLADGKYNMDKRVSGVLDKLLEVLIA